MSLIGRVNEPPAPEVAIWKIARDRSIGCIEIMK